MEFLDKQCTFSLLNRDTICECPDFSCGHDDLDDFFLRESEDYNNQLLGKSYCFRLNSNDSVIVCAFTVSNSSIKMDDLPRSRRDKITKSIPRAKYFNAYPAVLIGRLGVNKAYQRKGIAKELMNFVKAWFIDCHNKTGCRFIVVDSYNAPAPLAYYSHNGFEHLFSTEEQERKYLFRTKDEDKSKRLDTRLMFFDLIRLTNAKEE